MKDFENTILSYLIITFLLYADLFLYFLIKVTISGYWFDRILFWIWFCATLYLVSAFWKRLWIRRYFYFLCAIILLSVLPMAMPFVAIILSSTGQGLYYNKKISDKYRFEVIQYGFLGRPVMNIDEQTFPFEKEIITLLNKSIPVDSTKTIDPWEIKNVDFIGENDNSIFLNISSDKQHAKVTFTKYTKEIKLRSQ
ncbi:hypothetical protein [Flavobacterium magnum]|nr:hypothetical protein [Flavobacterium magnum]